MYTICPQCFFVHSLGAADLAPHAGKVQCVRCDHTFNALDRLYDEYPDGRLDAFRRNASGPVPELGRKPAPRSPASTDALEPPVQPRPLRWPWVLIIVLLTLVTLGNLAWTLRDAIPRDHPVAETLHRLSVPGFAPEPPFRDPERIHLVTRDIHEHPTRRGILVLSATFVNLAERAQPYPDVVVTLRDRDDRPIAARAFAPADYLVRDPGEELLPPDRQVPILLEFAEPERRATGFELEFR